MIFARKSQTRNHLHILFTIYGKFIESSGDSSRFLSIG